MSQFLKINIIKGLEKMKIILLFLFILATAYGLGSGSDKYVSWN